MFETAELGHELDRESYERQLPELRESLLKAQYEILEAAKFPVILVVAGVAASGKGEAVSALTEWLDPRHVRVHAMGDPSDEELERPPMWRFWRRLPPKGKLGVFFDSWYAETIRERALEQHSSRRFAEKLGEIRRFESMLTNEGALLLKVWFHLSKKQQRERIDSLWADKATRYRVQREDLRYREHYSDFREAGARALIETDTPNAPWSVLAAANGRYRDFNFGSVILDAMKRRLQSPSSTTEMPPPVLPRVTETVPLVRAIDLSPRLSREDYELELRRLQRRLALLSREKRFSRISPVLVFEGVDAAGKGGAIRRLTQALDPRRYDVHPIAAPSEEERAQPYLWRFWRHAPRDGKFAIFDRSWYGRVLVERVERFASEATWLRAYGEINDFESQLMSARNVLVKFWLQISPEEQLRRFQEREQTPFKRFKITPDDWRNREKWLDYERAASDMIERTSTKRAPWSLIAAEDKHFARVEVLRHVCEAIEHAL